MLNSLNFNNFSRPTVQKSNNLNFGHHIPSDSDTASREDRQAKDNLLERIKSPIATREEKDQLWKEYDKISARQKARRDEIFRK